MVSCDNPERRDPIRSLHIGASLGTWGRALVVAALCTPALAQDPLRFPFEGRRGQVEVGGPYAGVEFHHSRPVPSRISFFLPVANSIDLSTDYWKRDESIPLSVGLSVGDRTYSLARESWGYTLSPFGVEFRRHDGPARMSASYAFGSSLPMFVLTMTVVNTSQNPLPVEMVTDLLFCLRTCQTYTRLDSSVSTVDGPGSMISASFTETQAQQPVVFVGNLGAMPDGWSTDAATAGIKDGGEGPWINDPAKFEAGSPSTARRRSAAIFHYRKVLLPGDSLQVIQAIGSAPAADMPGISRQLGREEWRADIKRYEDQVRRPGGRAYAFITGDPWIDRAAAWSRSLVEASQHVLNGSLVPMPCPSEYNFFFTHDALLSGLGILNVDAERVRRDLTWIAGHAKDAVIPHAAYWRDSSYETEYCAPSNWNHLWFLLLSSRYVRYTHDTATGLLVLPCVERSMRDLLTQIGEDGLVHAPRPDWWDIGWRDGPRAYLTALLSRALDEYVALRISIGRGSDSLAWYEGRAAALRHDLRTQQWDVNRSYLFDRNGGDADAHVFAGPLVAAVYGAIPDSLLGRLVRTAERELQAPGVGIRAVMPADFNLDSVKRYYNIKDNEAGDPYRYINGGVWPHLNAWFALALHAAGRTADATAFVRQCMTVDGVASSPSGVPAMYEYRMSDASSGEYGAIDKPSFLWAGGFTLFTLYRMAGVRDGTWNISFDPTSAAWPSLTASWVYGGRTTLAVRDSRSDPVGILCDGKPVPSYVLPLDRSGVRKIEVISNGEPRPILADINSILHRVWAEDSSNTLHVECSSFDGHSTEVVLLAPRPVTSASVDGRFLAAVRFGNDSGTLQRWTVSFRASSNRQRLTFTF